MAAEDSLPFQQRREDFARKAFPPAPPHKLETLNGPAYSNIVLRGFLLQGTCCVFTHRGAPTSARSLRFQLLFSGGHPGTTTAEIANNITPLLKAGVSTFVCLQPDLPSVATQSLHARSAFGSNVVSAKPYIQQAQSIVDAGMMPQSGGAPVSFIHVPIPAINGATLPDDQLKSLVRLRCCACAPALLPAPPTLLLGTAPPTCAHHLTSCPRALYNLPFCGSCAGPGFAGLLACWRDDVRTMQRRQWTQWHCVCGACRLGIRHGSSGGAGTHAEEQE